MEIPVKNTTKAITYVALFAALTAVGGFLKIPAWPVSVTLQTFFTLLSGILLGPWLGSLSQLIYVSIGLIGVPIFASGGGPGYVLSPSFGYLLGFIIAPLAVGAVIGKAKNPRFLRLLAASLAGTAAIYAVGVPYLYFILNSVTHTPTAVGAAFQAGLAVFIPGDIVKIAAASLLGMKILPALRSAGR